MIRNDQPVKKIAKFGRVLMFAESLVSSQLGDTMVENDKR